MRFKRQVVNLTANNFILLKLKDAQFFVASFNNM